MKWIKIYVRESLRGSLRLDLNYGQRGIWYDLLLMAGDSRQEGVIQAAPGLAYPVDYIASTLRTPEKVLRETITLLEQTGRITIDKGIITIVNWHKYQSEYTRQKPSRDKKSEPAIKVEDILDPGLGDVVQSYLDNIKPTMGNYMKDELESLCEEYPSDQITRSFELAAEQGKPSLAYAKGILRKGVNSTKPIPFERQEYTLD